LDYFGTTLKVDLF